MPFTQTDVDALRRSIAQGTRAVQYADRSVSYHSLSEMIELLRLMEAEVAAIPVDGAPTRAKAFYVYSTKGF